MADWVAIKNEYFTTQISTRDLAQKHGVPYSTLRKRAEKEAWVQGRKEWAQTADALVAQKTMEAAATAQADRIVQLMEAGERAVRLLNARLEQMERSGKPKAYEIKAITESLKHARDLYRADPAPDSNLQKARELLGGVPDGLD